MHSLLLTMPFEAELDRYGSEYVDISELISHDDMHLFSIVYEEIELLNTDWNGVPLQFLTTFDRVFTDEEGNRVECELPRVLSRGWCSDRNDLLQNIPNYDPDVVLVAEWVDDYEPDWSIFIRLQFLDRPELHELKKSAIVARLRGRSLNPAT